MTPDEHIDLEERIALVWDGAPASAPITWAEAERIARDQQSKNTLTWDLRQTVRLVATEARGNPPARHRGSVWR